MCYKAFEGQDSGDLHSTRKKTFVENLRSQRANQYSDDHESSNNINVKRDERQKKFGKRQLNTKMDKVIDNFIFISLVKYTLQSPEGQKQKEKQPEEKKRGYIKREERSSKEARLLSTSSSQSQSLSGITVSFQLLPLVLSFSAVYPDTSGGTAGSRPPTFEASSSGPRTPPRHL